MGTNGSGKTTLAKSIIAAKGLKEIQAGKNRIQISNDGKTILLGKYDGVGCGGCDTINTKDEIKNLIAGAIRKKAETIIYEGVIISGNFTLAKEVKKLAETCKYDFLVIWMDRDLDICLNSIYERNGGKDFKIHNVYSKARSVAATAEKMMKYGIEVKRINPDDYTKEEIYSVCE